MEDRIKYFFNKLYRKNHTMYVVSYILTGVVLLALLAVIIGVSIASYNEEGKSSLEIFGEIFVNTIASLVGILLAYFLYRFLFLVSHRNEDKNKVSYANADMWKQYHNNYRQQFCIHDNRVFTVYCEPMFCNAKNLNVAVDDYPDEFFELDSFIKTQFFNVIEAHAMSESTNSITVRLKEVVKPDDAHVVIRTMRSTYLSHMLTNRALDYELKPGITIRSLFENTDRLIPPQRSRMSNHLGVNALVFLKQGENKQAWLLLPERGSNATVAKNKVTASIATRVKMKDYTQHLTTRQITEGCIREAIKKSVRLSEVPKMEIEFLGLSRDIYEGGKPTLFYAVYLDMTKDHYKRQREKYEYNTSLEQAAKHAEVLKGLIPKEEESIDEVKTIHVVDWSTVTMGEPYTTDFDPEPDYYDPAYDKALLEFTAEGVTEHKAFEQNLIANFWFLQNCKPKAEKD